jgi:RNA polymerase sigma factor (sigma-70 family)
MSSVGRNNQAVFVVGLEGLAANGLFDRLRRSGSQSLLIHRFLSGEAFLEFVDSKSDQWHGCVVLELKLPDCSGLELQRKLLERGFRLPFLFVTAHGSIESAVLAMKQHAADFIRMPDSDEILTDLILDALQLDRQRRSRRQHSTAIAQRIQQLTPREREVMQLIVAGLPNKRSAAKLRISEKTIEAHRTNLMRKMQADGVVGLVRMALSLEHLQCP